MADDLPSLGIRRRIWRAVALGAALVCIFAPAFARAEVFSGPQPGERTSPFKSIALRGDGAGQERDIIAEHRGAATTLVFVHGIERSMAPLIGVLDEYGKQRHDRLKTEFVFLSRDPIESRQRLPMVGQSLRLASPMSLSVDGIEGPGNYGLNKECLLTVIVARDDRVQTNFALVQPGIADAPGMIAAIAKVIGDESPPSVESLRQQRGLGQPGMRGERMREGPGIAPRPAGGLPGATPTDEKLVSLMRRFIQRTNDDATVDQVLRDVETHISGNPGLTQQAINGWTRVLHLKYGTEYAQRAGRAWLEKLKP